MKNKYILKNHLCCASKEIPLKIDEYLKFGIEDQELYEESINELVEDSLLM
ncbi:MAG: hypothetical protein ACTSR5_18915, partial [Promethearchaeota archaeon]